MFLLSYLSFLLVNVFKMRIKPNVKMQAYLVPLSVPSLFTSNCLYSMHFIVSALPDRFSHGSKGSFFIFPGPLAS